VTKPRFKIFIPLALAIAALVSLAPPLVSEATARVVVRPRHRHRARVAIVVGRPVVMVRPVVIAGVPHGAIDFDVTPETTEVYVDGTMRGQVDDFDGVPEKLYLRAGTHLIALKTPGGETVSRKVRIVAGHEMNLKLDLEGGEAGSGEAAGS
jgi:PEGA domain-containing protein